MKEDNRKPWSVKLLQGAERVLSASGMWGWLMLSSSSSAPATQLKWGLQSPPGRITGPHLSRGGVTRLAALWGFASRSGKEDGLPEREGCPREPGLQAGEDPWLQMRLAAVAGAPAQQPPQCRVCLTEKGAVWGGWKDPFTEARRTPGSQPPSWDTQSIWVTAPSPRRGAAHVLTDCGAARALRAPRAPAKAFCGSPPVPPWGGTKRIQCSPTRQTSVAWGVQLCEGIQSEKTAGQKEP